MDTVRRPELGRLAAPSAGGGPGSIPSATTSALIAPNRRRFQAGDFGGSSFQPVAGSAITVPSRHPTTTSLLGRRGVITGPAVMRDAAGKRQPERPSAGLRAAT